MNVKLKKYRNEDTYNKDFPDKEEFFTTVKGALEHAREKIALVRGTNKFLGYKIFDKHGDLVHKLPSR